MRGSVANIALTALIVEEADARLDAFGVPLAFPPLGAQASEEQRTLWLSSEREHKKSVTGRCQFFLKAKNRPCSMSAMRGSTFCGSHDSSRVECPFDRNHRIAQSMLAVHMRRCAKGTKTPDEIEAAIAAVLSTTASASAAPAEEEGGGGGGGGDADDDGAPGASVGRERFDASAIKIVYEDDDLVVVSKPSGLRSVVGIDTSIESVQSLMADKALIVHRIDRLTSGLLIMPKTKAVQSIMSQYFQKRGIDKVYAAVVRGIVQTDTLTLHTGLKKLGLVSWRYGVCALDDPDGKIAVTFMRVLHRDLANNQTHVSLHPTTGRSHQLRVHMASIGHPICFDDIYSTDAIAPGDRMLLHAATIVFHHPTSRELMQLQAPLPDYWPPMPPV